FDACQSVLAIVLTDCFLSDLARHVAIDSRHPGLAAVGRNIIEHNRISCERADMRDAIAHLTRADNSDTLNIDCQLLFRSTRSPGSWLRIRLISILSLHSYDVPPHDAIARSGKIATWSTLDLVEFRSQLRQGLVE